MNGYDFSQTTALITGGAGDIGAAVARRLLSGGARVATLDLRAAEIEGALAIEGDVSRSQDVDAAVTRVEDELGPLTVLDFGEFPVADVFRLDHVVVDHPDAVLADRAHGQLGLGGQADLADQDDVQPGTERPGDLIGDRDAAPGQADDHAARSPLYRRQAGQQAG